MKQFEITMKVVCENKDSLLKIIQKDLTQILQDSGADIGTVEIKTLE